MPKPNALDELKFPDKSESPQSTEPSRRSVVKVAAIGAAGAAVGAAAPAALNRVIRAKKLAPWRFLTEAEASLLEHVCEQIIPADQDEAGNKFPGARETGAVNFIDRQLAGTYQRFQGAYRNGLAALAASSLALKKTAFEKLPFEEQTKLLQMAEGNKLPKELWREVASGEFFRLVRDHTMQGFYGSPRHGGNKDYASYKMLGLEYPRIMGRNVHKV